MCLSDVDHLRSDFVAVRLALRCYCNTLSGSSALQTCTRLTWKHHACMQERAPGLWFRFVCDVVTDSQLVCVVL
jgi:hypothetical protein